MSVSLYGSGNTVIQVQSTTLNTTFSTTAASFTDLTGLTVSITPQSTTSKILIFFTSYMSSSSSSGVTVYNLVRDSTNICPPSNTGLTFSGSFGCYIGFADNIFPFSGSFLDAPVTTSPITYKLQLKTNVGTVYINRRVTADANVTSTITAMEIAYS
jgi:hypothetical protein